MMSELAGDQIDYCPECRGVWLERRALDRIIEHSGSRDDRRDDQDRHGRKAQPAQRHRRVFRRRWGLTAQGRRSP
jgi:Zn-finger nucleic acid-binding protein